MASRIGKLLTDNVLDFLIDSVWTVSCVLLKSILYVPLLYLVFWMVGRGHPTHDLWLGYWFGAVFFTNTSQEKRDRFKSDFRRRMKREVVPPPPSRLILPPFTGKNG